MGLSEIKERVKAEAIRVGRAPEEVTLIAVSKVQPDERVEAVLGEGHRVFGENRVQEAAGKWPGFKENYEAPTSVGRWIVPSRQQPRRTDPP